MQSHTDSPSTDKVPAQSLDKLIRLPAALEIVGLGRSAWLDLVREGKAPKSVKIGRATLWVAAEVHQFVRDRIRLSRGG